VPTLPAFTRRFGLWPRRLAAIVCLLLAVLSAIGPRTGAHASTAARSVIVATRALPVGTVLVAGDLRSASWPSNSVPPDVIATPNAAIGRRLAGPLGVGELVTSTRLVGAGLSTALPSGLIAVPVPLADAASIHLIQAGEHVDLLRVPTTSAAGTEATSGAAEVLASSVLVLAALPATDTAAGQDAELVVAATASEELRLAAAVGSAIVATVRAPP
jgi:pilus assembly protein CpaB